MEIIRTLEDIQNKILCFLENDLNSEDHFQNMLFLLDDTKKRSNMHEISLILHLISSIANNSHRFPQFFSKIEKILLILKDEIQKYFTNRLIFHIFMKNKRILLFFIEQKIIILDEKISKQMININYGNYFLPELKPFMNNIIMKNEIPENFLEKRNIGENDNVICELIRGDMIKDFIVYVNKNNIPINSTIPPSIYETNPFLTKKKGPYTFIEPKITLIEYATFFGAIQIFNYLKSEGAELTPSLWYFAIHGHDSQNIQILEDNNLELEDKSYLKFFYESIKCHHNDFANYFLNNFLKDEEGNSQEAIKRYLKYYNFAFLKKEFINKSTLMYLAKYDYFSLVDNLLQTQQIDINKEYSSGKEEQTALYAAVEQENIEIIKLLLNVEKVDVNIPYRLCYDSTSKKENTALFAAVQEGNAEIVKLLLNNEKIDVNIPSILHEDSFKEVYIISPPLFVAVQEGNAEIVKLLLSNEKIDVNLPFKEEDLDKDKSDVDTNEITPLYLAASIGNTEIVKLLLSNEKIDVNIPCVINHYYYAGIYGLDDDENKLYLYKENEKFRDTYQYKKTNEMTPLFQAVSNGNIEIVKFLLNTKEINPNIPYKEDFTGEDERFKMGKKFSANLLEYYKREKTTPFYLAVERGNINIIKILLEKPEIDVNQKSFFSLGDQKPKEKSPLPLLVEKRNDEIVQLLLQNKKIDIEQLKMTQAK